MCSCSVSSIRQVPRLLDQTVVAHIDPLHTYAYIYTHKYTCVACHTQSYCICIRTCIKYKKSIEPITSSRPRFASSWGNPPSCHWMSIPICFTTCAFLSWLSLFLLVKISSVGWDSVFLSSHPNVFGVTYFQTNRCKCVFL